MRRFSIPWRLVVLLLVTLCALPSCGTSTTAPKLVPVQGKVVYRNKGVASVQVQLLPEADSPGQVASAWTGPEGTFTLQTHPHGDGGTPGRYRVQIAPYPGASTVPAIYTDPNLTPLRIVIPESGHTKLVLNLVDQ